MAIEWVRKLCKSLPHTTEEVLWGGDLVFKIGGKMFAAMPIEPAPVCLSLRVTGEEFAELCEREGVIPAPYLARYSWISLEREERDPGGGVEAPRPAIVRPGAGETAEEDAGAAAVRQGAPGNAAGRLTARSARILFRGNIRAASGDQFSVGRRTLSTTSMGNEAFCGSSRSPSCS